MLPYIITQLFPNVKFFPAQGGSYKEILHFVHLLNVLCVPLRVEIRYDEQNLWSDKSALFIEIIFQPKRNDPCVVPRNPSTKRARQPHSATSPYFPKRQKLPPRAPALKQSETNLRSARAGAFGGSSREVREVWRVGPPLRKRGSCASKVFLTSNRQHSLCGA